MPPTSPPPIFHSLCFNVPCHKTCLPQGRRSLSRVLLSIDSSWMPGKCHFRNNTDDHSCPSPSSHYVQRAGLPRPCVLITAVALSTFQFCSNNSQQADLFPRWGRLRPRGPQAASLDSCRHWVPEREHIVPFPGAGFVCVWTNMIGGWQSQHHSIAFRKLMERQAQVHGFSLFPTGPRVSSAPSSPADSPGKAPWGGRDHPGGERE